MVRKAIIALSIAVGIPFFDPLEDLSEVPSPSLDLSKISSGNTLSDLKEFLLKELSLFGILSLKFKFGIGDVVTFDILEEVQVVLLNNWLKLFLRQKHGSLTQLILFKLFRQFIKGRFDGEGSHQYFRYEGATKEFELLLVSSYMQSFARAQTLFYFDQNSLWRDHHLYKLTTCHKI